MYRLFIIISVLFLTSCATPPPPPENTPLVDDGWRQVNPYDVVNDSMVEIVGDGGEVRSHRYRELADIRHEKLRFFDGLLDIQVKHKGEFKVYSMSREHRRLLENFRPLRDLGFVITGIKRETHGSDKFFYAFAEGDYRRCVTFRLYPVRKTKVGRRIQITGLACDEDGKASDNVLLDKAEEMLTRIRFKGQSKRV